MDKQLLKKANKIKLIATDIDGVWTDGSLYYNEKGYAFKQFSTYDGMGVELLKNSNIETVRTPAIHL